MYFYLAVQFFFEEFFKENKKGKLSSIK